MGKDDCSVAPRPCMPARAQGNAVSCLYHVGPLSAFDRVNVSLGHTCKYLPCQARHDPGTRNSSCGSYRNRWPKFLSAACAALWHLSFKTAQQSGPHAAGHTGLSRFTLLSIRGELQEELHVA